MAALLALVTAPAGEASAELFPLPGLPPERRVRLTFEIVPADSGTRLGDELREIEGGRLLFEEAEARGGRYRKTTIILPLPSGDTRERVVFFAEEEERVRMLGFHRIHRHHESPSGETLVFDSGTANPLTGRLSPVPADTYSYLGLFTALGGIAARPAPAKAHLWVGEREVVAVDIVPDGAEELQLLGTKVKARRLRVAPRTGNASPAVYWFAETAPHSFLQYRGPGDFLTENGSGTPPILLRATSSSEQVKQLFGES